MGYFRIYVKSQEAIIHQPSEKTSSVVKFLQGSSPSWTHGMAMSWAPSFRFSDVSRHEVGCIPWKIPWLLLYTPMFVASSLISRATRKRFVSWLLTTYTSADDRGLNHVNPHFTSWNDSSALPRHMIAKSQGRPTWFRSDLWLYSMKSCGYLAPSPLKHGWPC